MEERCLTSHGKLVFEPQAKVVQFWSCLVTITNKQTITVLEDHLGKVVKVCEETSVFGQEKWSKDVQPFRVYTICHSSNMAK